MLKGNTLVEWYRKPSVCNVRVRLGFCVLIRFCNHQIHVLTTSCFSFRFFLIIISNYMSRSWREILNEVSRNTVISKIGIEHGKAMWVAWINVTKLCLCVHQRHVREWYDWWHFNYFWLLRQVTRPWQSGTLTHPKAPLWWPIKISRVKLSTGGGKDPTHKLLVIGCQRLIYILHSQKMPKSTFTGNAVVGKAYVAEGFILRTKNLLMKQWGLPEPCVKT